MSQSNQPVGREPTKFPRDSVRGRSTPSLQLELHQTFDAFPFLHHLSGQCRPKRVLDVQFDHCGLELMRIAKLMIVTELLSDGFGFGDGTVVIIHVVFIVVVVRRTAAVPAVLSIGLERRFQLRQWVGRHTGVSRDRSHRFLQGRQIIPRPMHERVGSQRGSWKTKQRHGGWWWWCSLILAIVVLVDVGWIFGRVVVLGCSSSRG